MIYSIEQENLKAFFKCPFQIYDNFSYYTSPFYSDIKRFLSRSKNPLLYKNYGELTYFTCHNQNKICGRIVVSIHKRSNEKFNSKEAHFGFFDCINDLQVAKLLLETAENWAKTKECTTLIGNFNLTAMQQIGIMTSGFENPPFVDQMYTPVYLPQLLDACGYKAEFPMTTFKVDLIKALNPDIFLSDKSKNLLNDKKFHIKNINRFNFKNYMSIACDLLNSGFENNPMFVGLDYDEFWFQAKEMMWVIDPRLTIISYYDKEPVGIILCIPDLNPLIKACQSKLNLSAFYQFLKFKCSRPKRAVIVYYSVQPKFHGQGINQLMLLNLHQKLIHKGYQQLGITWVADQNKASLKNMQQLNALEYHKLSLFKKELL